MTSEENPRVKVTSQVGPAAWVPAWVIAYCTGADMNVYVALRSYADRSGEAHPRMSTIANRACVALKTTEKSIQKFRKYKLLTTKEVFRAGGGLDGWEYRLTDLDPGTLKQLQIDEKATQERAKAKKEAAAQHASPPQGAGGVPSSGEAPGAGEVENTPPLLRGRGVPSSGEAYIRKNTPIEHTNKEREKRAKAGKSETRSADDGLHTLPEDFSLTDAMRRWTVRTFGEALDPDEETTKFIAYWRSEGRRKRNWYAAWEKWMHDAKSYAAKRGTNRPQSHQDEVDAWFERSMQRAKSLDALDASQSVDPLRRLLEA